MNDWIADRSPKEPDDYIVTVTDRDYIWVTVAYFGKEEWWEDYDACQHNYDKLTYKVLAWMPFPKPYEEVKHEEKKVRIKAKEY